MSTDFLFGVFSEFQKYYIKLIESSNETHDEFKDIETYLKVYYKDKCGLLYHISDKIDLSVIRPSSNFDMYGRKHGKKVFATSNPYEIWLYACRAVSGEMHEKNRICIYPSNPIFYYRAGYYYLKKSVAIYVLDIEKFSPVLNIGAQKTKDKIRFDNEWASEQEIVPMYQYVIERIPKEFTYYYDAYYINSSYNIDYPKTLKELQYFMDNNIVKKI